METADNTPGYSRRNDVLIDCLYVVAIGINVALIVDASTDGALSKATAKWLFMQKNRYLAWHERNKELRRDRFEMFMQAHEVIHEAAEKEG